jgi:hypothetical protein
MVSDFMRYLIKTAFLFIFIYQGSSIYAQSPRRDTLFGSFGPHAPFLRSIYEADVIEGRTVPQTITPTSQKICFDKKMRIKTITSRGPAEICVFINTKIGLIGYTPLKQGADAVCDIKPELSNFRFSIIGLKGNVYNYFNNKKKDVLEHWVQTGNSATYQYEFSNTSSSAQLRKKAERRDYCDGKVKAQLYKVDGQPQEWFLFGKQYPDAITMEPKKFLGQFAVGYQYSDKGLFIIMQMTAANIDSKILELEDVETCFDPSPFKVFEDEQQTKMTEQIAKEREKIAREEGKSEKYPACQSKKTAMLNYQKEALNRQEENLSRAQQGNMSQNAATQQAQANLMNYDDMIQSMIYETELKLCRAQQSQAENPSDSKQKKIQCLQQSLAQQKQTQQKFQQINTQYRNEPGKQFVEKAKEMLKAMTPCD